MKIKRILTMLLVFCVCQSFSFGSVSAESSAYTVDWSGSCDTANTHTVDIGAFLPADAKISDMAITEGIGSTILSSVSPTWIPDSNEATLEFVTRVLDEPANGRLVVSVTTSNYGIITVTINISLTGKYIVNIKALARDALYDGSAHNGFSNLSGTLTSGAAYSGTYTYTYTKADGTPLSGAPTEIGDYKVTIAVSESDEEYTGSLTLEFSIVAEPEVSYQSEKDGEWKNDLFGAALENVYDGGTIKLLTDITVDSVITISKDITITSDNAENPYVIGTETNSHGYLLNITGTVMLKNVIIDGGSLQNLTAKRALIAISGGKLTLGNGSVTRNNNNTTSNGIGGGVCVISGELVLDGGTIKGNTAYFGGGVGMIDGVFNAISGSITLNNGSCGGGVAVWFSGSASGTLNVTGNISVTGNNAQYYGAGILCAYNSTATFSGNPIISGNISPEETNGGIYNDGNPTDGHAVVNIGALTEGADINFYTWMKADGLVLAKPASGYTLTAADISGVSWNGSGYVLELNSEGNVALAVPDAFKILSLGDDKKSAEIVFPETGTYTVVFADYEGGTLSNIDTVTEVVENGEIGVLTVKMNKDFTIGNGDKIMLIKNLAIPSPLCDALVIK